MAEYFNSRQQIVKKGDVLFEGDQRRKEMKTKFIIGGRQTGKTAKLIREAVEDPCRAVIVVANRYHVVFIRDMLYKMYGDRNIIPVVTIGEIVTHSREVDGVSTSHPKLYIDDLIECLSQFNSCDIEAVVINDDERIREYTYRVNAFCNGFLNPHIDHVIFNGPATIVFWKDGTKTVVKHDGKGRKDKRMAIMYAFMRKIYGEGKAYHNILCEIEEALK